MWISGPGSLLSHCDSQIASSRLPVNIDENIRDHRSRLDTLRLYRLASHGTAVVVTYGPRSRDTAAKKWRLR